MNCGGGWVLQEADKAKLDGYHAKIAEMKGKMEAFAKMMPTAYLINTARGPVVHEIALTDALQEGDSATAVAFVRTQLSQEAFAPLQMPGFEELAGGLIMCTENWG